MSKKVTPDAKALLKTFVNNYFMQELKFTKQVFDLPPPKPGTQDFAQRYARWAHGKKEALGLLKVMTQFQAGMVDHPVHTSVDERAEQKKLLRAAQEFLGIEQQEAAEIMRQSAAFDAIAERMRQKGIDPDTGLPMPN